MGTSILFGVEPVLADPDVPWFYNRLTFGTSRGVDLVRCEIEPSYQRLRLTWQQGVQEKLSLDLRWVRGLRIVTDNDRDYFVASFRDQTLLDLEFYLRPSIRMVWGTKVSLP